MDDVRPPKDNRLSLPHPDEVVVFAEFFEAGLWFPCSKFLGDILSLYKLEIQQLTPNVLVCLAVFAWLFRAEGGAPLSRVFAELHFAKHWPKKVVLDCPEEHGDRIVPYGSVFFLLVDEEAVPAKAYWERWNTGWVHRWFYHKVSTTGGLSSRCRELEYVKQPEQDLPVKEVPALRAQVSLVRKVIHRFSMRDLTEEFIDAGICLLAADWSVPVAEGTEVPHKFSTFTKCLLGEAFAPAPHHFLCLRGDPDMYVPADLTLLEIEALADVLLGAHHQKEWELRHRMVSGARLNWVLLLCGVATLEWPELEKCPSKGQHGRKRVGSQEASDARKKPRTRGKEAAASPMSSEDDGEDKEEEEEGGSAATADAENEVAVDYEATPPRVRVEEVAATSSPTGGQPCPEVAPEVRVEERRPCGRFRVAWVVESEGSEDEVLAAVKGMLSLPKLPIHSPLSARLQEFVFSGTRSAPVVTSERDPPPVDDSGVPVGTPAPSRSTAASGSGAGKSPFCGARVASAGAASSAVGDIGLSADDFAGRPAA